jgi:hypothetical protein
LKAPNSKHPRDHIENQLNWGEQLIDNNGYYIMTSNLITLKEFVTCLINENVLSAIEIQYEQLKFVKDQLTKKTIKF